MKSPEQLHWSGAREGAHFPFISQQVADTLRLWCLQVEHGDFPVGTFVRNFSHSKHSSRANSSAAIFVNFCSLTRIIGIKSQFTRSKWVPVLFKDAIAPLLLLCILMIAEMFRLIFGKPAQIRPCGITRGFKFCGQWWFFWKWGAIWTIILAATSSRSHFWSTNCRWRCACFD